MNSHNEGERGFTAAPCHPHSSQQTGELVAALVKARAEMGHAIKNAKNPHFRSDYADLSSVIDACMHALLAHGLVVTQHENGETLATYLRHSSGQWLRSDSAIVASKPGPQAHGSALTYARRYALAALLCLAQADDDGERSEVRGMAPKSIEAQEPDPDISGKDPLQMIKLAASELCDLMSSCNSGSEARELVADWDSLKEASMQVGVPIPSGVQSEFEVITAAARRRQDARRTARAQGKGKGSKK